MLRLFLDKIDALKCGWNERPLTEEDFHSLCKRSRITVDEMPLRVSGFYYCLLGRHYIAVNSRLGPHAKLFVMFHEFGHFLMHAPDHGVTANFHGFGKRSRKELEADAFALCAILPRRNIEGRSSQELIEEDGFSEDLVEKRIELLGRTGI